MKNILVIVAMVTMLQACASMPTVVEMQNADFGSVMTQEECEAGAKSVLNSYLKDPYTAQYSFGRCERKGLSSIPILGVPKQFGYYMPVSVNAKNSFGGYTGAKAYGFLFKNGSVIRKLRQDDDFYGNLMPF